MKMREAIRLATIAKRTKRDDAAEFLRSHGVNPDEFSLRGKRGETSSERVAEKPDGTTDILTSLIGRDDYLAAVERVKELAKLDRRHRLTKRQIALGFGQ